MRPPLSLLVLAVLTLSVAACSKETTPAEITDQSKLSGELEERAKAIEEKADQAVLEAERDAEAELVRIKEEAEVAATQSDTPDGVGDGQGDSAR